jgi:hypothetical protein
MADSYTVDIDYSGNSSTNLDTEGFVSGRSTVNKIITLSNVDGTEDETSVRIACQQLGLIAREGQSRAGSFFERCVDVAVTRQTPLVYRCVESYQSPPRPQEQDEDQNANPWDLPAKVVSVRSAKTQEPIDEDADGDPIRNPGTDEAVEGLTRPVTDTVFVMRKNYLLFNLNANRDYNDSVNSGVFNVGFASFPAGTVKIEDINGSLSQHNGTDYWTVEITFVARKAYNVPDSEAWYHRRACKGFYEVKGGAVVRAVDDQGEFVTSPVYLDSATGERKPVGDPADFITTKVFTDLDFNVLGLF